MPLVLGSFKDLDFTCHWWQLIGQLVLLIVNFAEATVVRIWDTRVFLILYLLIAFVLAITILCTQYQLTHVLFMLLLFYFAPINLSIIKRFNSVSHLRDHALGQIFEGKQFLIDHGDEETASWRDFEAIYVVLVEVFGVWRGAVLGLVSHFLYLNVDHFMVPFQRKVRWERQKSPGHLPLQNVIDEEMWQILLVACLLVHHQEFAVIPGHFHQISS